MAEEDYKKECFNQGASKRVGCKADLFFRWLDENQITTLQEGAFTGLTALRDL